MIFLFLFLLIIVVAVAASCVKIVPQARAYVVEFLGAYKTTWQTGLYFKIPLVILITFTKLYCFKLTL